MMKKGLRIGLFLLFAVLLINTFLLVSAADTTNININTDKVNIDVNQGAGKVLGFLKLADTGSTTRDIILAIIVLAIFFVGIYDLLEMISIFSMPWVKLVIAIGLSLSLALLGVIWGVVTFMLKVATTFGTIAIFIEIIISIAIFIGLSLGSTWIAKWAAKRKGNAEEVKAIKSAGEAKAAIRGLREVQEEFKRKQ